MVEAAALKGKTQDPDKESPYPGERGSGASERGHGDASDRLAHEVGDLRRNGVNTPGQQEGAFRTKENKSPSSTSELDLSSDGLYARKADAQIRGSVNTDNDQLALLYDRRTLQELYKNPSGSPSFQLKQAHENLARNIEYSSGVLKDQTGGSIDQKGLSLSNLAKFEQNARKKGWSDKDIADTYKAINDMMESRTRTDGTGKPATNEERRALALTGFLQDAANTDNIDQGFHNTCNVNTLTDHQLENNPKQAAERLRDLMLDGQYLSKGLGAEPDQMIKIDEKSLKPDQEAQDQAISPKDGKRNYYGQLAALGLVNDFWQRRGLRYEQQQPNQNGPTDTGERLVSMYTGRPMTDKNGKPINSPLLNADAVNEIGQRLGFNNFIYSNRDPGAYTNVGRLDTRKAFEDRLEKGAFSMVVDSGHPLYRGAVGEGGQGGGHLLRVSKSERPGYVHLDNSWGSRNDGDVPIDLFLESTKPRDQWQLNNRPDINDNERNIAWTDWQKSGGSRLAPDGVLRQTDFEDYSRSFEKQRHLNPDNLTDKDKKEEEKTKELLAHREKQEQEQKQEQSDREAHKAQLERVVTIDSLQSQLAYAKNNSEIPEKLVKELNQTLASLLSSRVA